MKHSPRIKAYNKKYQKQLEESLRIIEPFLIQAFTLFYGEEYRVQIEYTIKNMHYTYFLSETFFQALIHKGYDICNKDRRVAEHYYQYIKKMGLKMKSFQDIEKLRDEIMHTFIIWSSLDKEIIQDWLSCISVDKPIYVTLCDREEQRFYKTIFLPLFVVNLPIIIHEVNHAFMEDVVAISNEEYIVPMLFINEDCEELFNEYISELVLKEYKRGNGSVPYPLKRFLFENDFSDCFDLIIPFYEIFEELIKKSIMTKNFNLLWEKAGVDHFNLFCQLVQRFYLQRGCGEKEWNEFLGLILEMKQHMIKESTLDDGNLVKIEDSSCRIRYLKKEG